jgi:hypothetical protein
MTEALLTGPIARPQHLTPCEFSFAEFSFTEFSFTEFSITRVCISSVSAGPVKQHGQADER